jgi:hypothetical protein
VTRSTPRIAGRQSDPERSLYLAELDRPADWPEMIVAPAAPFILFLAMDARRVGTDEIFRFAERLLGQGVVYVCTWGPDCERVHDLFEEAEVIRDVLDGVVSRDVVMTTWHADETLDEALWFALKMTLPAGSTGDELPDLLAIVIGHAWAERVERRLNDL